MFLIPVLFDHGENVPAYLAGGVAGRCAGDDPSKEADSNEWNDHDGKKKQFARRETEHRHLLQAARDRKDPFRWWSQAL